MAAGKPARLASFSGFSRDRSQITRKEEDLTGAMVAPGEFTVTLSEEVDGMVKDLSGPTSFKVERLRKGALEGASPSDVAAFWKEVEDMNRNTSAATMAISRSLTRVKALEVALKSTNVAPGKLDQDLHQIRQTLLELDVQLNGNRSKQEVLGPWYGTTLLQRLAVASTGTSYSTYGPTPMHRSNLDLARKDFNELRISLNKVLVERIPAFEKALIEAGGPWVEGQEIPE